MSNRHTYLALPLFALGFGLSVHTVVFAETPAAVEKKASEVMKETTEAAVEEKVVETTEAATKEAETATKKAIKIVEDDGEVDEGGGIPPEAHGK